MKNIMEFYRMFFFENGKLISRCAGVGPVLLDHSQVSNRFCAWKCILKLKSTSSTITMFVQFGSTRVKCSTNVVYNN